MGWDDISIEDRREAFVNNLLAVWEAEGDDSFCSKMWAAVTRSMVYVGNYQGWSGADKKQEVLKILALVFDKTDAPGPDFIVDRFIAWAVEAGIDYLYDAFKGKFPFDGTTE